eukprot:5524487-Ditylum_brightwellii.AAC.1
MAAADMFAVSSKKDRNYEPGKKSADVFAGLHTFQRPPPSSGFGWLVGLSERTACCCCCLTKQNSTSRGNNNLFVG